MVSQVSEPHSGEGSGGAGPVWAIHPLLSACRRQGAHAHQVVHGTRKGQPPPHPSDPMMSHLPLYQRLRLYPRQPLPRIHLRGSPEVQACALLWTSLLRLYGPANDLRSIRCMTGSRRGALRPYSNNSQRRNVQLMHKRMKGAYTGDGENGENGECGAPPMTVPHFPRFPQAERMTPLNGMTQR
jgi:hypothetical protein